MPKTTHAIGVIGRNAPRLLCERIQAPLPEYYAAFNLTPSSRAPEGLTALSLDIRVRARSGRAVRFSQVTSGTFPSRFSPGG
jgi:hypothetical protein